MAKSLKPLKTLAGGLAGRFASRNNRYGEDWALAHLYDEVFKDPSAFVSIPLLGDVSELSPIGAQVSANFRAHFLEGLERSSLSDDVIESARIELRFTPMKESTNHQAICTVAVFLVDFLGKIHTQSRRAEVIPQSLFGPR